MMESESLPAFDTVIERKPSAFTTPPRTKLPSGLPGVYQFYSAIFHKRSLHGKTMGDFESAFAAMDLNGDGVLSREEFRRACKDLDLGLSPSQVAELLNHMDKDNSGDIDIHEFIRELKEAISQGGYDPNAIAAEKVKGRLAELGFGTQKPLELRHECQECRGRQMPKLFNCTCGLSVLGHTVYADNEPGECQCFESEKDKKKRLAREKKERQRLEAEKRRKEMQRRMRARQQEEQDKLDAASSRQSLYT
eukprot:g583.t1